MKILMLLSNPINVDTRVEMERKALVDAGHEVDIVCRKRDNLYHTTEIDNDGLVFYTKETLFIRQIDRVSRMLSIPAFNAEMYKRAVYWYTAFKYDVIHAHDFDTLCVAVALKLRFGVPVVYDAHEIYNKMVSQDVPPIVCKVLKIMENYLLHFVDKMIVISQPYMKYYIGKTNADIFQVTHYKPLKWERYHAPNNDKFTLLYIGNNLSEKRSFPYIIDITAELGINLRLGGMMNDTHRKIIEYIKEKGYNHVELLGQLPDGESILDATRKADATFVLADPDKCENYRYNLFNKQFEAMAAGRPILVVEGMYAAQIVKKTKSGLVIPYEDAWIKAGLKWLKNDKKLCEICGKNAIKAAREKYNWEKESKNLVALYDSFE